MIAYTRLNYSFTKILKPDNFGPLLVELAASKFKPIETSPPQICQSMLSTARFHSSIHFFSTILSTFIIHQITTSPQDFAPECSPSCLRSHVGFIQKWRCEWLCSQALHAGSGQWISSNHLKARGVCLRHVMYHSKDLGPEFRSASMAMKQTLRPIPDGRGLHHLSNSTNE